MPSCFTCPVLLSGTAVLILVVFLVAAGCIATPQAPSLSVTPAVVLSGDPVTITITGIAPGERVRVEAVQEVRNATLHSYAVFVADGQGRVLPDVHAPVDGTYGGVDPQGLFWSLAPGPGEHPDVFSRTTAPSFITISARTESGVNLSRVLERRLMGDGVTRVPVNEAGVRGTLFLPNGSDPHPALIYLGGSEGGVNEGIAAIFASKGYVTLALAYFGVPGLPQELVGIPVENVGDAVRFLNHHPRVKEDHIAIYGASKGAELALLSATRYPEIRAVIANSPASVVFQGISMDWSAGPRSSWSENGSDLPYVPFIWYGDDDPILVSMGEAAQNGTPWGTLAMYERALGDEAAVSNATIPVERINGPVLLLSAGKDTVWPSSRMSGDIMARLAEYRHPFPDMRLDYPGSGHMIRTPWQSTELNRIFLPGGMIEDLGGIPPENAKAAADSWPKVQEFLRVALGS
ncbi:MAG TPA: acyl-CoA thioester hydrolase/BAAT C-terminal domain-containing protein [Methanolinea sp.]|nr:acyl-CoA thioester hydrolase/BAAT C-terminal domain-containing protein [Methanolinea sp.]